MTAMTTFIMSFLQDTLVKHNPVDGADYVTRIASHLHFHLFFVPRRAASRRDVSSSCHLLKHGTFDPRCPTTTSRRHSSTDAFIIYKNIACTFDLTLCTTTRRFYTVATSRRRKNNERTYVASILLCRDFSSALLFLFFSIFYFGFFTWRVPRVRALFRTVTVVMRM